MREGYKVLVPEGYKVPELIAPFPITVKKKRPYRHWFNDDKEQTRDERSPYEWGHATHAIGFDPRKEQRHRHIIGWLQVIATVIAIIVIVALCNTFLSASHAEDADTIGFPSYWEMDAKWTKQTQSCLVEWGYEVSIDGKFGPKTAQAVKEFQLEHDLPVTGVVDETTAEELGFELEAGRTLYYMADLSTIVKKSKDQWLIYISLGGRGGISHVGVFENDAGWKLVKSEDCATGDQANGIFTPLGKYTISQKMGTKTVISEEGYVYVYRNYLSTRNGPVICSVPQLGGEQIDTTTGMQSSDGNVYVSFDLSKWLKENVPNGTVVVIDDRAWQPSDL